MCLANHPASVKDLLDSGCKTIVGYKVLVIPYTTPEKVFTVDIIHRYHRKLVARCRTEYTYKPGLNVSTSRVRKPCLQNKNIFRGIHLGKTRKDVKHFMGYCRMGKTVCVKVTAKVEDVIGVSFFGEIVVRQVVLSKREYDKALRTLPRNKYVSSKQKKRS